MIVMGPWLAFRISKRFKKSSKTPGSFSFSASKP